MTPQKGFDLLVEAVRRLVATGASVRASIAGRGRDAARLAAVACDLPIALLGHRWDVPAVLAGCDIFCLPSRAEGLPLALLEAMMAGRPCVTTDVGQIRVAVGDAAIVVPPTTSRR